MSASTMSLTIRRRISSIVGTRSSGTASLSQSRNGALKLCQKRKSGTQESVKSKQFLNLSEPLGPQNAYSPNVREVPLPSLPTGTPRPRLRRRPASQPLGAPSKALPPSTRRVVSPCCACSRSAAGSDALPARRTRRTPTVSPTRRRLAGWSWHGRALGAIRSTRTGVPAQRLTRTPGRVPELPSRHP